MNKVVAVEVKGTVHHCGSPYRLTQGDPSYQTEGEQVQRHQVVEVPPIRPEVTEYQ